MAAKTAEQVKAARQAQAAAAREVRLAKIRARQAEIERQHDDGDMSGMSHSEPLLSREEWGDNDMPVMAGDAQHVVLFSTKDGVASKVRIEQLVSKLMPDKDGRVAFSERPVDPTWQYKNDPITGVPILMRPIRFKCRLHRDSKDREWLDSIGLSGMECSVDNIPSEFQLALHMEHKHRVEWQTMQNAEQRKREDEERERQRAFMEAIAKR